jgi:hypothetical protein
MGWKHGTISNQLYRPEARLHRLTVGMIVGTLLLVSSFYGAFALRTYSSLATVYLLMAFYIAGGCVFSLIYWFSGWVLDKLFAWRYVRAFEAIAAKRLLEGST